MLYLAAVTIPKRNFSFVIKFQCPEYGPTGLRETLVLNSLGVENFLSPDRKSMVNWQRDPYDPGFDAPLLRNRAESEEWDSLVPDHPLSRARGYLARLQAGFTVDDDVRTAPPFAGPS